MEQNSEDAIAFFNRLLAQLHQADQTHQGSINIEFVYVASGGQHVDTIQTQNVYTAKRQEPDRSYKPQALPDELSTDAAMTLWHKVQRAGYVDENYQPTISRTQAAILANAIAERLGIRGRWKHFETLWNRKYMRSDYNLSLSQQQSLDFQDELKRLLAG